MHKHVFYVLSAFLNARRSRECILVKVHSFPRTALKHSRQMLKSLCACLSRLCYEVPLDCNAPPRSFSVNCSSAFCHSHQLCNAQTQLRTDIPGPADPNQLCHNSTWIRPLSSTVLPSCRRGPVFVSPRPNKGSFLPEASRVPAFLWKNTTTPDP